jgi:hypothetical protein
MKNHDDDHLTRDQLRQFVEKYGPEIREVVREQQLTGVDDATKFQKALAELAVRWGVLPSDTEFSDFLAKGIKDDEPK